MKEAGLHDEMWQAFAVSLRVKTVGVGAMYCTPCIGTAARDIAVCAQGSSTAATAVPSLSNKNFSSLHCIDLPSPAASSSSSSLCHASTIQVHQLGVVRTTRPQSQSRTLVVVASKDEVKDILILGGTRFFGIFLARLLIKEGYSVILLTSKSPVTNQLPGESEEYASYSSQVKTHQS